MQFFFIYWKNNSEKLVTSVRYRIESYTAMYLNKLAGNTYI